MKFLGEAGWAWAGARRKRIKAITRQGSGIWGGAVLLLLAGANAAAAQAEAGSLAPDAVFAQVGTVSDTHTVTVGASWDWRRTWAVGSGRLSLRNDAWLSQWRYPDQSRGPDRTSLWQVAFVPVLRYRAADGSSPWFVEAGVGASLSSELYTTDRRRFSTAFNFADHLGVGRSFGAQGRNELAIRLEHYSNGGIKAPNAGVTLVALRYTRSLN